jgi:cobalamin biosynthesis Co2+ chelatase CbiK
LFQGIAVVGGCLAVLTALLPLLLKGGEEAFEEMKEQDKDKWGKNNSDTLKKRR